MPGERRTLRSSKESSSSTNGEKSRPDSQNPSTAKDKPVPARTASSKTKPGSKKPLVDLSPQEDAAGKTQPNGAEPVENGINGTEDIEMADEVADQAKPLPGHDGEDEMTVVVPPPKSSKLSGEPNKAHGGDVPMEGVENNEDQAGSEVTNPTVKLISGQSKHCL